MSLIEIMVATVVLGVCGASLVKLVGAASQRSTYAREKQLILIAAKNSIDEVRRQGQAGNVSTGTTSSTVSGLSFTATISRTVSPVAGHTRLFDVTVVASWSGTGQGRSGSFQLDSRVLEAET